jgi:hypothetical protein
MRLEIALPNAYPLAMDRDHTEAPPHWSAELARAEAELARGESVPATLVHNDINRALADLGAEAGDAAGAEQPAR